MPLWGIVLLAIGCWILLSVALGVIIGRAVKIADAHRRDQVIVHRLERLPAAELRPSPPLVESERGSTPSTADAPAAHAADRLAAR